MIYRRKSLWKIIICALIGAVLSPASWQCWPENWSTHLCDVRSCRELGVLVEAASIYLYLLLDIYAYEKSPRESTSTLWSYQLLQKGRRFSAAKLHYIDFNGPLMPLSCIDIRYWVSYNPEICQKSWKMTSRKKDKIFRVGSNLHIFRCINS